MQAAPESGSMSMSSIQRALTLVDVSGLHSCAWGPLAGLAHAHTAQPSLASALPPAADEELPPMAEAPPEGQPSPGQACTSPFSSVVGVRAALAGTTTEAATSASAEAAASPGPSSSAEESASAPVGSAAQAQRDMFAATAATSFSYTSMGSFSQAGLSFTEASIQQPPGCPPHGVKAVCGKRAKMEDAFTVQPNFFDMPACSTAEAAENKLPARIAMQLETLSESPSASQEQGATGCGWVSLELDTLHFFGVYDGHGGSEAATHCANRLHHHLSEALKGGPSAACGAPTSSGDGAAAPPPLLATSALKDSVHVRSGSGAGIAPPRGDPDDADMACSSVSAAEGDDLQQQGASCASASPAAVAAAAAAALAELQSQQQAAQQQAQAQAQQQQQQQRQQQQQAQQQPASTAEPAAAAGEPRPASGDSVGADSQSSSQTVVEPLARSDGSSSSSSLLRPVDTISSLLQTALHNAFLKTDAEFASDGCAAMVGSTAVVALIGKHKMWIANCGDSRAVLCRSGKVIQLTDDHKPEREDEAARVEKAGGQVLYWNGHRVMGVLAMSRAIGDHGLRPYVIPEPEITVVMRCDDDDFLLLASDGLWDVMANQEATNLAIRCMHRAWDKGASRKAAARIAASVLTKAAIDRGSKDNVTVLIVDLSGVKDPPARANNHHVGTCPAGPCDGGDDKDERDERPASGKPVVNGESPLPADGSCEPAAESCGPVGTFGSPLPPTPMMLHSPTLIRKMDPAALSDLAGLPFAQEEDP